MPSKRSYLAAFIVVGLGATLGSTALAAHVTEGDSARVAATDPDRELGLVLHHIMVDAENPNFIVPCVKVLRKHYNKAQHGSDAVVSIGFTYTTTIDGAAVQRAGHLSIPLSQMQLTQHHDQPGGGFLLVDTTIDVGEPVDEGSPAGTAELTDRSSVPTTQPGS